MNAVIYARYSSDNQREESITAQLRACREYCRKKGYILVREYTDEAMTGTNDDRAGYLKMIKDAQKHLFDVAIFHKIDRNARNEYDYYINKMKLLRSGIHVEYASLGFDIETPEGQLMENQLVGMAAYYSRNLSNEVRKGLKENALQGISCGGIPPFGYKVVDKTYYIDEREAMIVRFIFKMYVADYTYGRMVAALREKNYLTRAGRQFCKNSIREIIRRNKKYSGIFVYGVESQSKLYPGRKNEVIEIPGGMPAIIDQDTYKRASYREKNFVFSRGKHHAKVQYLLSGLMTCGACGKKMVGCRAVSSGKRVYDYTYYKCRDNVAGAEQCAVKTIRKDFVEGLVKSYIQGIVGSQKSIDEICKSINKLIDKECKTGSVESNALKREERSLNRKMENLLSLVEDGAISDVIRERIKKLHIRLVQISERLIELQDIDKPKLDPARIYEAVKIWNDAEDEETVKAMFQTFVSDVRVFPDRVEVDLFLDVNGRKYSIKQEKEKRPV